MENCQKKAIFAYPQKLIVMTALLFAIILLFAVASAVLAGCVAALKSKNERLYGIIRSHLSGNSGPVCGPGGAEPEADAGKKAFAELDSRIRREKLYLLPNLSRDTLVSITGMSKNNLAQFIQQHTGQNFASYINSMRLDHSLKRLVETEDTIETVAYDSGFNNARTFYRIFREQFGMTPAEYRKSFR